MVEETNWNVGHFLDYLGKEGLVESTLVTFTSDNGPWLSFKGEGDSTDPLRGGRSSYYEDGVRVPCITRWKGAVPAGMTGDATIASIDFFPTIMHHAGNHLFNQEIDGINVSSFFGNPSSRPRDECVYIRGGQAHGIRKGDWVYLPKTGNSKLKEGDASELFNLKQDVGESGNPLQKYPDKVKELQLLMQKYQPQ